MFAYQFWAFVYLALGIFSTILLVAQITTTKNPLLIFTWAVIASISFVISLSDALTAHEISQLRKK